MLLKNIDPEKKYFKTDLLSVLKSEKLHHTKPTWLKNERLGIIPKADILVENPKQGAEPYRVYLGETIIRIVDILEERKR